MCESSSTSVADVVDLFESSRKSVNADVSYTAGHAKPREACLLTSESWSEAQIDIRPNPPARQSARIAGWNQRGKDKLEN